MLKYSRDSKQSLPYSNAVCMNVFLRALSAQFPDDIIILVLDGAPWHKVKTLNLPQNIYLIFLPPATPEMNPIEQIWKEIRKRGFRNEIFIILDNAIDRLSDAVSSLSRDTIMCNHRYRLDYSMLLFGF